MDTPTTGGGSQLDHNGYRAPQVCRLAKITYRQLDHWARTGLLEPSLRTARGSGTQRLYSYTDVVQLRVIKRLLDTGISLPKIRKAVEWLRSEVNEAEPLKDSTLLSDGINIWWCDNSEETQQYMMDILRKGQGVFAIATGQVQRDLLADILELFPTPAQLAEAETDAPVEAETDAPVEAEADAPAEVKADGEATAT